MQTSGTAYGVALNDRTELEALEQSLQEPPYAGPPRAPVVYIKPQSCLTGSGSVVMLPPDAPQVTVSATLAVKFARKAIAVSPQDGLSCLGEVALAADLSLPGANYYRPAIAEKCRDGFLPLGRAAQPMDDISQVVLETYVDGTKAHVWRLDRLVRSAGDLIAELSAFMSFLPEDVLLLGLAGDAPLVASGSHVAVRAVGLPELEFDLATEARP